MLQDTKIFLAKHIKLLKQFQTIPTFPMFYRSIAKVLSCVWVMEVMIMIMYPYHAQNGQRQEKTRSNLQKI